MGDRSTALAPQSSTVEDRRIGMRRSLPRQKNFDTPRSTFRKRLDVSRQEKEEPPAVPYTTSASEFLYGTNVVAAALKTGRRKFYKLYMHDKSDSHGPEPNLAIRRMALECGVPVTRVAGYKLRMMDRMSAGRPHNVRNKPLFVSTSF